MVELTVADPHDPAALARCFEDMDAVVNLVGVLHEGGAQTFDGVHEQLPGKVAEACRAAGVQHLLHMSSLGAAASAPSRYQQTKAAGFFFSSRRRHTRWNCDWSSDVCSSD